MASGEMTPEEFTAFLTKALDLARAHACPGAIIYACMDWRHMVEMRAAGDTADFDLINLCVWVPGANSFKRNGRKSDLDLHPTVKPIAMVADAILDSTNLDDIVLDPFLGSGTTLLAAERARRRCYGVELDPLYVDTAIMRWERLTQQQARLTSGQSFAEVRGERSSGK